MSSNAAWLALHDEAVIDPDLPICDAHHHLWTRRERTVAPRYLIDELMADIDTGHNIVSAVYVEADVMHRAHGPKAMKPVGEVEFANGVAAMSASGFYGKSRVCAGIVGIANLDAGAAAGPVIDAMIAAAPNRFRGIRCSSAWDADKKVRSHRTAPPHQLMDAGHRAGVAELGRRGLIYEARCFHPQLGELANLARALPDVEIVLDHAGGPIGVGVAYEGKRAEVLDTWKSSMAALAGCDNVSVKLGGIFMEVNGFGWPERPMPPTSDELAEAARPYFEFIIETFGADRAMFESNFPVEKASTSYNVLWNAFKKIARGCSPQEKAKLFHDTATRIYRIEA